MASSKQTWLITGCSSGLGEAIAHAVLRRGDNVIATARKGVQRLQALKEAGAATLDLDVQASQAELDSIIEEALKIYGGIDVLVNNAAYIEAGVLEELSHERLVSIYHTNFFGAVNLTRSLLPHLRHKQSGNLVYVGSMGAYVSEYASVPYISTKGVLDSFIDCVSKDVSLFNIKCMLAIFGEFRTSIYSETNVAWAPTKIGDYAAIHDAVKDGLKKADHAQHGDPNKAAERLVDGVKGQGDADGRAMPTRLIIGADAFQAIRNKCRMMLKVCDEWEDFGTNTSYDGVTTGGFVGSVL